MVKVARFIFVSVFIGRYKTLQIRQNLFLNNNCDQDKTQIKNFKISKFPSLLLVFFDLIKLSLVGGLSMFDFFYLPFTRLLDKLR